MTDFERVGNFHERFNLPRTEKDDVPRELPLDLARYRLEFLIEELTELAEGYGFALTTNLVPTTQKQSLTEVADALVDLSYVTLGTAHYHRLPWSALFQEVHLTNMAKQPDPESKKFVQKPEGWRPPNMVEVLMRHGWPGPRLPF